MRIERKEEGSGERERGRFRIERRGRFRIERMRKVQDGESRGRCRIERKRMVQVR